MSTHRLRAWIGVHATTETETETLWLGYRIVSRELAQGISQELGQEVHRRAGVGTGSWRRCATTSVAGNRSDQRHRPGRAKALVDLLTRRMNSSVLLVLDSEFWLLNSEFL